MPYNAQTSKLKRARNQRRALLKLLAANIILHKKICTTETKAKSVRPFVERLVSVAKKDSVASRRYVARFLPKNVVTALHVVAAGYQKRNGGYTRIVKTASRRRDNTRMAFIEFV
ncbi:MAG: 50S ribosomal protein L17 [Candidatus Ryanbacteria bacterium RIFCSPHIGHO2_02_FULL_45_17b]|nr:MAG: 50S ribosomal protein L17 [Candidatus Ryanbacteria bacterium RIFCSPHIGHO2_02_FULL_45_17b]